jgi:class 3 adenylate cyclase
VHSAIEGAIAAAPAGELALKGFRRPVGAFSLTGSESHSRR